MVCGNSYKIVSIRTKKSNRAELKQTRENQGACWVKLDVMLNRTTKEKVEVVDISYGRT